MRSDEAARSIAALADSDADTLRLARLVSLASFVEPALVRAVRHRLAPGVDAGAEAHLWFSRLVQTRSPQGFVLYPEVAEQLRRGLTDAEAAAAFQLIERLHANQARLLRIEEEIAYLSLRSDQNHRKIEGLLNAAVATLISGREPDIANWAGRAVPRLPNAVRKLEPVAMLGVAADLRLGRDANLQQHLYGHQRLPRWLAAVLPSRKAVQVGVYASEAGIEFGPPGDQNIEVPATEPIVLELRWSTREGDSRLIFFRRDERSVPERVPAQSVDITTLSGNVYTVKFAPGEIAVHVAAYIRVRAWSSPYGVLIGWIYPEPIRDCIGFHIERRTRGDDAAIRCTEEPVRSLRYFDPFQQSMEACYRVVPIPSGRITKQLDALTSHWTEWTRSSPVRDGRVTVWFNRGVVPPEGLPALTTVLNDAQSLVEPAAGARQFLGGDLLAQIRTLLTAAHANRQSVYVAMNSLEDPEAIDALGSLGTRAHVLLAAAGRRHTSERDASTQRAAALLRDRGVEVHERIASSSGLAHNKFIVFADASNRPIAVWTGNTSLATAALTVRQNACVYVEDPSVAVAYAAQWRRLVRAGNGVPATLMKVNDGNPAIVRTEGPEITVWFTPSRNAAEIDRVRSAVAKAKEGIVFAVNLPAKLDPVLDDVRIRASRDPIHVAGIVMHQDHAVLFSRKRETAIKSPLPPELARRIRALLHRSATATWGPQLRTLIVDPFSDNPMVITGSHSFGPLASRRNDENIISIRGDRTLAVQCATAILRMMDHYAPAAPVRPNAPFAPGDEWQEEWFAPPRWSEARFWAGIPSGVRLPAEPNYTIAGGGYGLTLPLTQYRGIWREEPDVKHATQSPPRSVGDSWKPASVPKRAAPRTDRSKSVGRKKSSVKKRAK